MGNRNKNFIKDKRGSKPNNTHGRSGQSRRGTSQKPNMSDEREYFSLKTTNHATDYFSDQQLAEQCSYVSNRNILDAKKKIYDTDMYYPSIIVHAYNPCPSSTTYSIANGIVTPSTISIAATKLLTAIIANTGRIKNYTRTDVSFLILAIGQFIAMTEYARRTFGLLFKFNMGNRDIPNQLIEACGFDSEDFRQNKSTYLDQFNYWVNLSDQIVIPMDKIPYFRRCRDQFKDVYTDMAGGQLVYHVPVPYSTWIMDEDATPGARLRTINVTGPHEYMAYDPLFRPNATPGSNFDDTASSKKGTSFKQPHALWTFQEFLDEVYAPMINRLLYSDTFNEIYADLRNAKFQSQYPFEFWHAETVDWMYQAEIKDAPDMLQLYHNTMTVGSPLGISDEIDPNTSQIAITAWNDVVEDPSVDELVHNPVFLQTCYNYIEFAGASAATSANTRVLDFPIIMDFPEVDPSLDIRVDSMMQKYFQDYIDIKSTTVITGMNKYYGKINFILPLWYEVNEYTYVPGWEKECLRVEGTMILAKGKDYNNGWYPLYNAEYSPMVCSYGTWSSGRTTFGYDVASGSFVQANQTMASLAVNTKEPILTYVNGAPILSSGYYETRATGDEIVHQSHVRGNLDNWYKLPNFKLYNFFNHAYQHLFTAEDVIK